MAKAKVSSAVKDAVAEVAKQLAQDAVNIETPEQIQSARMAKTNSKGEMLMCSFTLQKAEGRPDPLCITVNDQIKWVKRGKAVALPWYFVEHMLGNQDRKYRQEKDAAGKNYITYDDVTSEPFHYQAIEPGVDANGKTFEIEGPRTQTEAPY